MSIEKPELADEEEGWIKVSHKRGKIKTRTRRCIGRCTTSTKAPITIAPPPAITSTQPPPTSITPPLAITSTEPPPATTTQRPVITSRELPPTDNVTASESTIQPPTPMPFTSSAPASNLATTSYQTPAIGTTTTTAAPTGGGFSFAGVVVPIMVPVLVVATVLLACILLGSNLFQKYKRRNHVVAINPEGPPVLDEEQGVAATGQGSAYVSSDAQAHVYENPVRSQQHKTPDGLGLNNKKSRHKKPDDLGADHYETPQRESGATYSKLLAGHGIYREGQQPSNNTKIINPVYDETDVDRKVLHSGYEEPDTFSENKYNALGVHQIYRRG